MAFSAAHLQLWLGLLLIGGFLWVSAAPGRRLNIDIIKHKH